MAATKLNRKDILVDESVKGGQILEQVDLFQVDVRWRSFTR